MPGTVSASLAREHLAVLGKEFLQGADVLVIDFVDVVSTESALALFAVSLLGCLTGLCHRTVSFSRAIRKSQLDL